ncbi:hypothetical protein F5141DRAFT_1065527 [Pisolithus sp. B1]|nr:hypothetical protein F5141DRAFT_1065527 [Pisolithus sp. B1]
MAVQTQNDYIPKWLPQKEDFLQILLDLEAPPSPHICKICGKDGDSALHMTGLQLHLGHDGAPCPSASMNVQATPSWHPLLAGLDEEEWEDIDYIPLHLHPPACQCVNAESYHKQLFCSKLYPSTFEKPSTAFTFLVLDDFLRDNVECGTSGMNYYSKLHWVTSMWQWCLLELLKWSRFQNNKNGSTKGDLALFCTACPQPGINLSPKANLDDWRYTRMVVMDGNFKAEHMHEQQPDNQVWLMDGHWLYGHQSVILGIHRSHSAYHGGVGATACAWHGCFYLHSVVDFQKGERQLNMANSLCNALSDNMNSIHNVICFYDINCTYMKNLQRWVDNTKFLEIAPSLKIMVGVRMWHVHGHKKECYARYSPLFLKGSGWVDSEIIETLWSTLNVVSTLTRGMTLPHCQELLDFQMNDSNFMKMICMSTFGMDGNHRLANTFAVSSLLWKLKVVWAVVSLAQEAFERLNDAVPSSQQENWQREEEAALQDHFCDPSVMDIFEIQLTKGHLVVTK